MSAVYHTGAAKLVRTAFDDDCEDDCGGDGWGDGWGDGGGDGSGDGPGLLLPPGAGSGKGGDSYDPGYVESVLADAMDADSSSSQQKQGWRMLAALLGIAAALIGFFLAGVTIIVIAGVVVTGAALAAFLAACAAWVAWLAMYWEERISYGFVLHSCLSFTCFGGHNLLEFGYFTSAVLDPSKEQARRSIRER